MFLSIYFKRQLLPCWLIFGVLLFGQQPYLVPAQPPIGFGPGTGGGGGTYGDGGGGGGGGGW
jgi:hypothetical protein